MKETDNPKVIDKIEHPLTDNELADIQEKPQFIGKVDDLDLISVAGNLFYKVNRLNQQIFLTMDGSKEFSSIDEIKSEFNLHLPSVEIKDILGQPNGEMEDDLFKEINEKLRRYIYFSDERYYTLLSSYIILSHCYKLFPKIPYIALRGEKGSGKSTILEVLSGLVKNPKLYSNMTPASIFRIIDEHNPTLLIDEVENLNTKSAEVSPIIQILNSGYHHQGTIPRTIKNEIRNFRTFCPKIIAGIHELVASTQDRCLMIEMKKAPVPLSTFSNSDVELQFFEIKKAIFRALHMKSIEMLEYLSGKKVIEIPEVIANRDLDLWRPLLIISKVLQLEDDHFQNLLELALIRINKRKVAEENKPENKAKHLIKQGITIKEIKIAIKEKDSTYVNADETFEFIEKEDNVNYYRSKAELTNVLKKIGVISKRRRVNGILTSLYLLPSNL